MKGLPKSVKKLMGRPTKTGLTHKQPKGPSQAQIEYTITFQEGDSLAPQTFKTMQEHELDARRALRKHLGHAGFLINKVDKKFEWE